MALYSIAPAVLPNLDAVSFRWNQKTHMPIRRPHSFALWPFRFSWWQNLVQLFIHKEASTLLALPTEILQLIASELPPASRASFSLTCKTLRSIERNTNLFQAFMLPSEQPHDFQTPQMSKPSVYQPARWEFLRFLERDLAGKWLLCSECFTLHPKSMFAEFQKSIVPWLKDYYGSCCSDFRTCRHWRKVPGVETRETYSPSGVVDLCPCIKLTIGKKRLIEAWLREKARSNRSPAADFWWHECRHVYGAIEIDTKIGLFLYDGTERPKYTPRCRTSGTHIFRHLPRVGDLGVLLDYHHRYPSSTKHSSPRLLCPHQNLHTAIQDLMRCCGTHTHRGTVCEYCKGIQYCLQCRTKVLDLCKHEDRATGIVYCSYQVERCLDGAESPMHTVFPFARRQIPLQKGSPYPPQ